MLIALQEGAILLMLGSQLSQQKVLAMLLLFAVCALSLGETRPETAALTLVLPPGQDLMSRAHPSFVPALAAAILPFRHYLRATTPSFLSNKIHF